MNIRSIEGLVVLVSETPTAAFWMAPPVQVPEEVQDPLLPFTASPPFEPVVFNTIPLVAPFDEMLRNSRLFAPIVVLTTLSAVPVVDVSVLTTEPVAAGLHGLSSQT